VQAIDGQSIPGAVAKKIDSLFLKWANKNTPGYAIGIVRNEISLCAIKVPGKEIAGEIFIFKRQLS